MKMKAKLMVGLVALMALFSAPTAKAALPLIAEDRLVLMVGDFHEIEDEVLPTSGIPIGCGLPGDAYYTFTFSNTLTPAPAPHNYYPNIHYWADAMPLWLGDKEVWDSGGCIPAIYNTEVPDSYAPGMTLTIDLAVHADLNWQQLFQNWGWPFTGTTAGFFAVKDCWGTWTSVEIPFPAGTTRLVGHFEVITKNSRVDSLKWVCTERQGLPAPFSTPQPPD
jgi:hypothetical protein